MITINSLSELVDAVTKIMKTSEKNLLIFRGEKKDYKETALVPGVYRDGHIENEDVIYRESQRFNNDEFVNDRTAFDKLSRIQHYSAPTRLIDVSEDLLSAVYFAIADKKNKSKEDATVKEDALVYVLEIDHKKIKYYDSDAVAVVANIAKIPYANENNEDKSKIAVIEALKTFKDNPYKLRINRNRECFNKQDCAGYLVHEIREEKPHFSTVINPVDLTSVHFVWPKLTSGRVRSQKGAFLLFGMNPDDPSKTVRLIKDNTLVESTLTQDHPVVQIHVFALYKDKIPDIKNELSALGIKKSFIYPEIDKVSEYLRDIHGNG